LPERLVAGGKFDKPIWHRANSSTPAFMMSELLSNVANSTVIGATETGYQPLLSDWFAASAMIAPMRRRITAKS
jgi:hypothetical protein